MLAYRRTTVRAYARTGVPTDSSGAGSLIPFSGPKGKMVPSTSTPSGRDARSAPAWSGRLGQWAAILRHLPAPGALRAFQEMAVQPRTADAVALHAPGQPPPVPARWARLIHLPPHSPLPGPPLAGALSRPSATLPTRPHGTQAPFRRSPSTRAARRIPRGPYTAAATRRASSRLKSPAAGALTSRAMFPGGCWFLAMRS